MGEKMDISNKTLAMLLVAAVVVSLAGTIISLNKLSSLSTTGYATSTTGTANVQVNTSASIRFAVSSLNWSSGSVNSTLGAPLNCTLIVGLANSAGCIGFTQVTNPLVLENDGNLPVKVELATDKSAATFIGGNAAGGPQFMYNVSNNESDSCYTTPTPTAYFTDVNTTSTGTQICDTLDFKDANDTLKIYVKINIPYDVTAGVKQAIFTATATQV